jgi:hypothetical protein
MKRRYDTEMIRDFLTQMLWELRTDRYQHTEETLRDDKQVREVLRRYTSKYGTRIMPGALADAFYGLQPAFLPNATEEQIGQAIEDHRGARDQLIEDLAQQLEYLMPLFAGALQMVETLYRAQDENPGA